MNFPTAEQIRSRLADPEVREGIRTRMAEIDLEAKARERENRRFVSECSCPRTCYFHTRMTI